MIGVRNASYLISDEQNFLFITYPVKALHHIKIYTTTHNLISIMVA